MSDSIGQEVGLPRISVLGRAGVEQIHELSLRVLEETGMIFQHPQTLETLRGVGATVDDVRQLARIPRRIVERALASAPAAFTLYGAGADRSRDCHFGLAGGHYARPSTGLNFVMDAGAKARREATSADAVRWARVADALPNLHVVGGLFPWDVPALGVEARAIALLLEHTDKPLMASAMSGPGMRVVHELVSTVDPRHLPRVMVLSSVNNPLIYEHGQLDAALAAAEVGIPVCFNSSAVAGATAPVTLAGDLALMNAEMLGALTAIQLHRPGAPVVHAGHPIVMDMRTGLACAGTAEVGLLQVALIEIGRYYGLPTGSDGVTADSPVPDANAAVDKLTVAYMAALAGANISGAAGSLSSISTGSLEQLVIDDDVYGRIFRQLRGIQVDAETLALDVIARVGPASSFIADQHTHAHLRREHTYSQLANNVSAPVWELAGSRDVIARAAETVHEILERPNTPRLDQATAREVRRIVEQATL